MFCYRLRFAVYFAFNFSEFPDDAIVQYAVFDVKARVVFDACYVDTYYFPAADWIQANLTKETAPYVGSIIDSHFILDAEEWQSYTSTSFVEAVAKACGEKGLFTVCLKAQSNAYEDSTIGFYTAAEIDSTYKPLAPEPTPSPSIPEFPSNAFIMFFAISVLITLIAVFIKNQKQ